MRVATQESQGGMRFKDNDFKIKIQVHRHENDESKEFPRTQGSKFKEGFILNDHPLGGDCENHHHEGGSGDSRGDPALALRYRVDVVVRQKLQMWRLGGGGGVVRLGFDWLWCLTAGPHYEDVLDKQPWDFKMKAKGCSYHLLLLLFSPSLLMSLLLPPSSFDTCINWRINYILFLYWKSTSARHYGMTEERNKGGSSIKGVPNEWRSPTTLYGYPMDPATGSLQKEIVNALHLGEQERASTLLSHNEFNKDMLNAICNINPLMSMSRFLQELPHSRSIVL
nr:hypothetical protein [Tanacetum cinerariifolium]